MAIPTNATQRQIEAALREVERKQRNKGVVTLRAGQTTTVVNDPRIYGGDDVWLSPRTANAAVAGVYVSTVSRGAFTITHPSNSQTDRTFAWMVA